MSIKALREDVAHARKMLQSSDILIATRGEVERALAEYDRLRAALEMVEAYLSSDESPLYSLWENGDICSWDDNPREKWEHVLEDLGDLENFQMTELDIGMGVKWEAVTIYRTILTALKKGESK